MSHIERCHYRRGFTTWNGHNCKFVSLGWLTVYGFQVGRPCMEIRKPPLYNETIHKCLHVHVESISGSSVIVIHCSYREGDWVLLLLHALSLLSLSSLSLSLSLSFSYTHIKGYSFCFSVSSNVSIKLMTFLCCNFFNILISLQVGKERKVWERERAMERERERERNVSSDHITGTGSVGFVRAHAHYMWATTCSQSRPLQNLGI